MKWQFILVGLLILISSVSGLANYSYIFPGTYTWTASANMSYASAQISGGGGSGMGGKYYDANKGSWGFGGSKGDYGYYTMIPVVSGTGYPIVVGDGGIASWPNETGDSTTVSHPGSLSSAFGHTRNGGAGGLVGSGESPQNGGDGVSTGITDLTGIIGAVYGPAEVGGGSVPYTGGAPGTGYGSGGGGAAWNRTQYLLTYGGKGGGGIVNIWDMNASTYNTPLYTASSTSAGYGTVITFTDESLIHDIMNLTYNWSFGDGTFSDTKGTVSHVYSNYGVFSTNLTLASDVSTLYNYKKDYITITNVPVTAWYTQKLVRLKIVDGYGAQLEGANISISYISSTLPSHDIGWLTKSFGVSQSTAEAMTNSSVAMQGYTDIDGSSVFMMFPAIQYGITITNVSVGLSKYITLNPQDTDYVIQCFLPNQVPQTSVLTHLYNSTLYVTEPNASFIVWNIIYQDTSGDTTALTWNITCLTNGTEMHTKTWGAMGINDVAADNYTFPSEPKGIEYKALYDATRTV